MRFALLLALTLVSAVATAADLTPAASRPPAPTLSLDDLDGGTKSLADHAGSLVVLSFWATWCGPCLQEIPFMNTFFERYRDQGLVVFAVNTDGPETVADVRATARRGRWTLPVLLDPDGAASAALNPRGMVPFTMFIDRQGRVAATHEGFSTGDEVTHEAHIQALLAEPR